MAPRSDAGLRPILLARAPLALFAALTAGWFLPGLLGSYAGVALPLYLPAYLVSMVTYDGLLGLEHLVYALQNAFGGDSAALWDAGLVMTFYLFSVVVALLGRPLEERFGPDSGRDEPRSVGAPSIRYTVAAGLLLVGLLLVVQAIAVQPTMTSVSCTDSSSASGGGSGATATATPECAETTEPATGAQLYGVGLGVATGLLGAGVVAADRRLAVGS